jgi:hypothetical protein
MLAAIPQGIFTGRLGEDEMFEMMTLSLPT